MPCNASDLRDLALARQADAYEAHIEAERSELDRFKSETLAPFSKWLNLRIEENARQGYLSIAVRFDMLKPRFPEWSAYLYDLSEDSDFIDRCPSQEDSFWVGSQSLPIDSVIDCVIEPLLKVGITVEITSVGLECSPVVKLSW